MRVALALTAALTAAALPAAALAADGPLGAMQRGLGWAFKRDAEPEPAPAPIPTERPEPMALSDKFARGRIEAPEQNRLPPPPARYRAAVAPPYQLFTPQVPLPLQAQARLAANQPASLYSGGAAAPAPVASAPAPKPVRAAQQTAPNPASPPPQVLATAPAPAPQRLAAAPVAPRSTGGATRLYSVHRGYGLEPDAIPEAPSDNRYVLIGPAASGVGALDDANDEPSDNRPGSF